MHLFKKIRLKNNTRNQMMDNIRKDKCAFYIKFIFYSYKLSLEL